MSRIAILMCAAAVTAGCATQPPPPPPLPPEPAVAAVDPNSPLAAPTYMRMAASGDLFEIQSSQIAHPKLHGAPFHAYATMIETDHRRMSAEMIATAQGAGLAPPPPALLPHHQAMLDQLRAAPAGPSFDMLYRELQINAHSEALQLHQNYASGGDHPALRAVAAAAVPVVQGHLSQAQSLAVAPAPPPMEPRAGERG